MATSVPMAAKDHHHQPSNPSLPQQDHDQHHPPIRRSSGRKKPKPGCDSTTGQKKKTPQRGMGVEKLERLMLQDRWKKMTEINPTKQPGLINAPHVSVQVSKLAGFSGPNCGQMGMNLNHPNPNPSCNLGFHHHGQMGHVSDHHQLQTDLFGNGCLNNSCFLGKNVNGISKELSSSPNVVKSYVPEHCNACNKKKKLANGENLGGGGRMIRQSDMYAQMYNVVEYSGFLGLSVGDNRSVINQENQGLGISAVPHVGYPVGSGKQGMEVVAVHRKLGGSFGSEAGNNHVLMEYEFFPSSSSSKIGDDEDDDDLVMMNEKKVSSESSSAMAGFDGASNKCIDLSLKLSY